MNECFLWFNTGKTGRAVYIMNMRTAILFTGQLRTIGRTARSIRKNLLESSKAEAISYCEAHLPDDLYDQQVAGSADIVQKEWGSLSTKFRIADKQNDKGGIFPPKESAYAVARDKFREESAHRPGVSEAAALWYRHAGTSLEYYQLKEAWELLLEREKETGERFDIVGRCRFDAAILREVNIANYYDSDIFWGTVDILENPARAGRDIFFASLLSGGDSIAASKIISGDMADVGYLSKTTAENFGEHLKASSGDVLYQKYLEIIRAIDTGARFDISDFLEKIPAVHAFRYNVLYFTRRNHFEKIIKLVDKVGTYEHEGATAWCSENQFGLHLINERLLCLNYHSNMDENYNTNISLASSTLDNDGEIEEYIPRELKVVIIRGPELDVEYSSERSIGATIIS